MALRSTLLDDAGRGMDGRLFGNGAAIRLRRVNAYEWGAGILSGASADFRAWVEDGEVVPGQRYLLRIGTNAYEIDVTTSTIETVTGQRDPVRVVRGTVRHLPSTS